MNPRIRVLTETDLPAYKALRDEMLRAHPDAFTSDAAEEVRKPAQVYFGRLGLDRRDGGHFLLGACVGRTLVGAIGCDRDARRKVHHTAQIVGMMVLPDWRGRGIARSLLEGAMTLARESGVEVLTLTVTVGNEPAERLYRHSGFERYGVLPDALRHDGKSYDKALMIARLRP